MIFSRVHQFWPSVTRGWVGGEGRVGVGVEREVAKAPR